MSRRVMRVGDVWRSPDNGRTWLVVRQKFDFGETVGVCIDYEISDRYNQLGKEVPLSIDCYPHDSWELVLDSTEWSDDLVRF